MEREWEAPNIMGSLGKGAEITIILSRCVDNNKKDHQYTGIITVNAK